MQRAVVTLPIPLSRMKFKMKAGKQTLRTKINVAGQVSNISGRVFSKASHEIAYVSGLQPP